MGLAQVVATTYTVVCLDMSIPPVSQPHDGSVFAFDGRVRCATRKRQRDYF